MSSQHGEEQIINKYLGNISNGKYLDIGAGEAIDLSNTYELYTKGWNGVLVEPYPRYAKEILEKRPNDKLCAKVITNRVGEMEMWDTAAIETVLGVDYKTNPMRQDNILRTPYFVPCYTMNEFLEEYPEVKEPDFLSLDIETGEEAMLSCTDFNVFKPKLMCIEYEVRGIDYRKKWEKLILPFYEPKELLACNAFYLRKA